MPKYVVFQESGVESDPLSGPEVLQWVHDGRIKASSLIRRVGSSKWHRAKDVPAIAALIPFRRTVAIPLTDKPLSTVMPEPDGGITSPLPAATEQVLDASQTDSERGSPPTTTDSDPNAALISSSVALNIGLSRVAAHLLPMFLWCGLGVLLIYIAGGKLVWGGNIGDMSRNFPIDMPFVFGRGGTIDWSGVSLGFNNRLYGVLITDRFFAAPWIQVPLVGGGFGAIYGWLKSLSRKIE